MRRRRSRTHALPIPGRAAGDREPETDEVARLRGRRLLLPGRRRGATRDELRWFLDHGYTHAKIKIGGVPLDRDLRRIEAAAAELPAEQPRGRRDERLRRAGALAAARALAPHDLWWLEDICYPLDFETHAAVAAAYEPPIAAGEALFSAAEARLLDRHGGLRRDRDILLFDPVHCYGIPGYLEIVRDLESRGWPRRAFWPHGGHLFTLHVAAALGSAAPR